jgi:transposase InsO family protein
VISSLIKEAQSALAVTRLCELAGISRAAYYRWRSGSSNSHNSMEADLRDEIEKIILEFPGYGYRRVTVELKRRGIVANHKRVLRIMRENNLLLKIKKSFRFNTDSDHLFRRYPNLIKDLAITRLDQVWIADITYIRLTRQFVYLAVILDAFSRKVVGWCLSKNIDTSLTKAALEMAIETRRPAPSLIHHSDQGVQYAAHDYVELLESHDIAISMSAKGNPYENAKAESFFATLKREEVYLYEYETYPEARARIHEFIEKVYNQKRLHSSLGYVSPNEFERQKSLRDVSILVVSQ